MAATYPLDVVEAARWLQDHENAALKGDQLFAPLQRKSWHASVKSLAPFRASCACLTRTLNGSARL
jgi:uncharacterized protein DUF3300